MATRAVFAAVIAAMCVGTAHASFFDDFSSYTDTASMLVPGAWGDDYVGTVPATLSVGFGNPAASMWHPGGRAGKHVIAPLYPSDAEPIVWQGDIWDDGSVNKRMTMGLRDNGGGAPLTAILEMGRYNTLVDPATSLQYDGYGIRTSLIGGAPDEWVTFEGNPTGQLGWHHLRATIRGTTILFELDLGADGIVDSQRLITTADQTGIGYNVLRLGGPGDSSSAGGGLNFDNISIAQVPEPATLAMLGLGGLFLRRRGV